MSPDLLSVTQADSSASRQITQILGRGVDLLNLRPVVEFPSSILDDLSEMLEQLGLEPHKWLVEL